MQIPVPLATHSMMRSADLGVTWTLFGLHFDLNHLKRALIYELPYMHELKRPKFRCSFSVGQSKANNRRNIEAETG